jgi:hypothetical protein
MTGTLILTENNVDKIINLNDELEIPTEDYPGEHEADSSDFLDQDCGCDEEDSACDEECECECHEEESEEDQAFDLNSQFGKYDFGIIFKTDTCDINLIVPEANTQDEEFMQCIDNFSQNAFLLNYVNFALNNKEWIDRYAQTFQGQSEVMMQQLLEESGLNDLLNSDLFKKFGNVDADSLKSLEDEEKYLDFDSLKSMFENKNNKPKIIT